MCVQDDSHLANTCDREGGPFLMMPIFGYEVDDFSYVACWIQGSIHIIDGEGSGETLPV